MSTIITCAITGSATKPEQTPYLPITPKQIVESGLAAADAGASILHIHVRDPQTGYPSMDIRLYEYVFNKIKQKNNKVLINLTTGPGSVYDITNKRIPKSAVERVAHIELLKPDLCSLDLNTMHQADGNIRINYKDVAKEMAQRIINSGTKPELELFDSGDYRIAKELYDEGLLGKNPYWQLVMGVKYGWDNTIHALEYAHKLLPQDCNWSAFGLGRMQMPFVAMSWCLGGNARVGLEDNIYISKGVLAKSNAELVDKAVNIIINLGGKIATPEQARATLKI